MLVLGTHGVGHALREAGIETVHTNEPGATEVDAVYVGWHPECGMKDIEAACNAIWAGAKLYTASDVPFFATTEGPAFGYSCAINGAIHRVTGVEPHVTGKPSQLAMAFVAAKLGLDAEDIAVVGDDPRVEIEMAVAAGALGVGVTSGTTSREQWAAQAPERRPDLVIANVGELLERWLS